MGISRPRLAEFGGREVKPGIWSARFMLPEVQYWEREQAVHVMAWVESEGLDYAEYVILEGKDADKIAKEVFEKSISTDMLNEYKKHFFKITLLHGSLSGDLKGFLVNVIIKTSNDTFPEDLQILGEFASFHHDRGDSAELLQQIIKHYKNR